MQHTRCYRCYIKAEGVLQMKYRPRIYYSASQRALIWDRWQNGETLHQIAGLFDRYHSSIQGILAESGVIRPAQRHRSRLALTLTEREEISRAVVAGQSMRSIATSLGRAASTVSREIRRNGGPGGYRASGADQAAWDRACRPKVCKLVQNRELRPSWPANCAGSGRPSRLPAGSSVPTQTTRPIRCHTRPSIAAYSSRPAGL